MGLSRCDVDVTLQGHCTAASAVCHITIAPGTNFNDLLGQFFLVWYIAWEGRIVLGLLALLSSVNQFVGRRDGAMPATAGVDVTSRKAPFSAEIFQFCLINLMLRGATGPSLPLGASQDYSNFSLILSAFLTALDISWSPDGLPKRLR